MSEEISDLKSVVESLVFVSGQGMSANDIAQGLAETKENIKMVLDTLVDDYLERDGGILIQESGGIYKFITKPNTYEKIQLFLKQKKKETLSKAMLETLAIITYKQPVTLFEIEEIRGVNSRSLVTALITKKLVKPIGQKETPGRPTLYGTTKDFLQYFGINSLEELPAPQEVKELDFEEL